MSESVGEVSLYVDADTTPYRRALLDLKKAGRALGTEIGRTTAGAITREMVRGAREMMAKLAGPLNRVRSMWAKTADSITASLRKVSRSIRATILGGVEQFKFDTIVALTRVRGAFNSLAATVAQDLRVASASVRGFITKAMAPLAATVAPVLQRVRSEFAGAVIVVAASVNRMKASVNDLTRRVATAPIAVAAANFGSALATYIGVSFQTAFKPVQKRISSALSDIIPTSVRVRVIAGAKTMGSGVSRALGSIANASVLPRVVIGEFKDRVVSAFRKTGAAALASLPPIKKFARGFTLAISPLTGIARHVSNSVRRSLNRMDRTVRLVLLSILFASGPIAALGSSMSASLVGVAGAAAFAVASIAPLVGLIAPLGLGIVAAVAGFKDLKKFAPAAANEISKIKSAFNDVAVPAFMEAWSGSLQGFFAEVRGFLSGDIFSGIGDAFSSITESLSGALSSGSGTAFKEALAGPLSDALGTLGSALGPILETLLGFFAAAAPTAQLLADLFKQWAEGLLEAFTAAQESGALNELFYNMVDGLGAIMGLAGALKDVLFTLFEAGVGPGTTFLDLLSGLLQQFDAWMNSAEGSNALQTFFDGILTLMPPLFDLVGALGTAIADLVTPEVIADTVGLLGALSDIAPVLSDVLSIIGEANIVNLLADAIKTLGAVIGPLVAPLSEVLAIASDLLSGILSDLQPILIEVGEAFGSVVEAIGPLLEIIAPLISALAEGFSQVLISLAPLILQLVSALTPLLTQLVSMLLPVLQPIIGLITTLAGMLGPLLTPIIQILTPILELLMVPLQMLEPILTLLTPLIELLGALLQVVLEVVLGLLQPLLDWIAGLSESGEAASTLSKWVEKLGGWIQWVADIIIGWLNDPNTDIGAWMERMWGKVEEWGGKVLNWFKELPGKIGEFFSGIFDKITTPFKIAFNAIADLWNNSLGDFSFEIPDWVPGVGGKSWGFPDIPKFATGGITDMPSIFGEGIGREAAVPLDIPTSFVDPSVRRLAAFAKGELGTGGTTNNVSMTVNTPAQDGKIVAKKIIEELIENVKG